MNILFCWRRLTPPAFIGGAELTEAELAQTLAGMGHNVTFIGSYENPRNHGQNSVDWLLSSIRETGGEATLDGARVEYNYGGLRCIATTQAMVLSEFRSNLSSFDVLFTSQERCDEIAEIGSRAGLGQVVSYVHSVSSIGMLAAKSMEVKLVAPSAFVQQVLREKFGRSSYLIRPPISFADRRVPHVDSGEVIFINPIPEKGLKVALEMARRLPEASFRFIEAWRPIDTSVQLPQNVQVLARRLDLSSVLERSRVLLVPSVVADASPRVISEGAQYGVPTIGSDRGGIPELVCNDRLLRSVDDLDGWESELKRLFRMDEWRHASDQQFEHCERLTSPSAIEILEKMGLRP